jgi:hypothetical protein
MKSVTKLGRTMPVPPAQAPAPAEVSQAASDAIKRKFRDTLEVSAGAQPWPPPCGCRELRD